MRTFTQRTLSLMLVFASPAGYSESSAATCNAGHALNTATVKPPPSAPRYVAGQQGPSGGANGKYCLSNDVRPFWRLTSVNVKSGNNIDAIDMTFEIPGAPGGAPQKQVIHCGGDSGSPNTLLTLAPDEYIVRILGRYGNFVDNLFVQTSKGQMRNFGNQNSDAPGTFDYIAPQGMAISGLVIRSCAFVDAVGVVIARQ